MPGTFAYEVQFVLLAILGAGLCMVPIFLLMRMTRNRKKEPVVFVSPDVARKHPALIWLIRGTGALIAGVSALVIAGVVFAITINCIRTHGANIHANGAGISIATLIVMIVIPLFYGIFLKVGYDMFRRVDATAVANFAFVFSVLSARDLYYLLPRELPKIIRDSIGDVIVLHRGTLALIVFFVLWHVIKAVLLGVLESNTPKSPQNPPPIDPDTPEFPQKSPLVQL